MGHPNRGNDTLRMCGRNYSDDPGSGIPPQCASVAPCQPHSIQIGRVYGARKERRTTAATGAEILLVKFLGLTLVDSIGARRADIVLSAIIVCMITLCRVQMNKEWPEWWLAARFVDSRMIHGQA